MPYSYRKLRGRIIELFGTQEAFARKIGLSKNSMSLKMNGHTSFSQADVKLWSELLGIKTDEIGQYFFT